jgi:sigma-B regulation protein RsbU (phosphoserine phosphatase)
MTVAPDFFETEPRNWRARLAVSVEVMRELSRYSDPQEMYFVFSRRMAQLFPVSRQLSISRRGLRFPQYRVTRFNLWTDSINPWKEPERLPVHEGGLLPELLYADQPRLLDDVVLDADDPAGAYLSGQRSLLAIPHFDQGTAQNMLLLAREEPHAFPRDRIADLVLLSNLFGRATQTLVLSQAVREAYDTVDYELRSIADIQKSLLPQSTPRIPGLDVAVHYQTAKRAGGDYYDFFALPDGKLGVLIADASGHGTPAAVLMAVARSIVHTRSEPAVKPGELLTFLNGQLTKQYTRQTGHFMTAFYAVFDPIGGTIAYASAGHNPPRLLRAADGIRMVLNRAQRLPLGIKADEVYPEQSLLLQGGDRVVFFTDGVIEAVNAAGDVFGSDCIDAALCGRQATAEQVIQAILRDLSAFTAGVPAADDRTLVVVKRQ